MVAKATQIADPPRDQFVKIQARRAPLASPERKPWPPWPDFRSPRRWPRLNGEGAAWREGARVADWPGPATRTATWRHYGRRRRPSVQELDPYAHADIALEWMNQLVGRTVAHVGRVPGSGLVLF